MPRNHASRGLRPNWRKRLKSMMWFGAIMATVAVTGVEPRIGFPLALGLIFLRMIIRDGD